MDAKDIISKHFSRVFKGYDIQEVDSFLDEIVRDYERYEKDNRLMVQRIQALLDEIDRLEKIVGPSGKRA